MEGFGDVAGAVGTVAEFRHCPQVAFFVGSQTVKANAKKTVIQRLDCRFRCAINMLNCNRGGIGFVPDMLSPFLKKIRISSGFSTILSSASEFIATLSA